MKKTRNTESKKFSPNFFAEKTERLQIICDILRANEKPLDELINIYEEGMIISKECQEYLNTMEGKIIDITNKYSQETIEI